MSEHNLNDLKAISTIYITPESIRAPVRVFFGGSIPFDPATEPNNPTSADYYCTKEDAEFFGVSAPINWSHNGLVQDWSKHRGVFVNPPYSREIRDWLLKLHQEVMNDTEIIALLPAGARYSTGYWQRDAFNERLRAICFVRGRVKFLRPDGTTTTGSNPYDSQIMLYNGDAIRFVQTFRHLGKVLVIDEIA